MSKRNSQVNSASAFTVEPLVPSYRTHRDDMGGRGGGGGGGSRLVRATLRTCAVIFHVIALIAVLVGLFSNSWEEANIGEEQALDQHIHGLWQYCTLKYNKPGEKMCYTMRYGKPRSSSTDKDTEIHDGQEWRLNTLVLLAIASCFGLAAVVCGCCGAFLKFCGVVWVICSFMMWILSISAVLLFTVYAKDEKEKVFYIGPRLTYQNVSWSYIVACGSTLITTIAMLLAGVTTGLHFVSDYREQERCDHVLRVHTSV